MERMLPWVGHGSTFPREFTMTVVATTLNAAALGLLAFGATVGVLLAFRVMS